MADMRHDPPTSESKPSGNGDSFAIPLFAVVLVTALLAGAAGHLLAGAAGWAVMAVVAVFGGVVAGVASQGGSGGGDSRARALVTALGSSHAMTPHGPAGWGPAWKDLYERVSELSHESKTSEQARAEIERTRRHAEMAVRALRDKKDPLTEIAELRVGPLRELLEAAREGASSGPVVSRLPLGEEELIGVDGEPLPVPWPKDVDNHPMNVTGVPLSAEARRWLDELIDGLSRLAATAARPAAPAPGDAGARTPAQLVDAVVHTAADGIEDLAAGLMRANELAAVAERVTNKATLLALNAALEATRSGSEAFAAIAEETRRLAEFAREATDTISRLSSEIEYKVGETITAIHATSEDAKSAVLALPAAPGGGAPARPTVSPEAIESLLRRARALREALNAPGPPEAAPEPAAPRAVPDDVGQPATPPESAASMAGPAPAGEGEGEARREAEPEGAEGAAPREGGTGTSRIPLLDGLMPGSSFDQ
ncbi:MAG TPA: methyl-accepting chemotaxis protein [Candidatus Eisenbacteria bacterium]